MQPEWIIGIVGVLTAVLASIAQGRKQSCSMLSVERSTELNSPLVNEEAIRDQLRDGNKIRAIKLYREQTGVGLKEAKDAIDRMALGLKIVPIAESNQAEQQQVDFDELQQLINAGQKINAIKLYRQQTGAGLKEAKDAIDRMALGLKIEQSRASTQPERGQVDPDELQRLISIGQKINAIKYYREATGVGLKEAKDAVEWLEAQMRNT